MTKGSGGGGKSGRSGGMSEPSISDMRAERSVLQEELKILKRDVPNFFRPQAERDAYNYKGRSAELNGKIDALSKKITAKYEATKSDALKATEASNAANMRQWKDSWQKETGRY